MVSKSSDEISKQNDNFYKIKKMSKPFYSNDAYTKKKNYEHYKN